MTQPQAKDSPVAPRMGRFIPAPALEATAMPFFVYLEEDCEPEIWLHSTETAMHENINRIARNTCNLRVVWAGQCNWKPRAGEWDILPTIAQIYGAGENDAEDFTIGFHAMLRRQEIIAKAMPPRMTEAQEEAAEAEAADLMGERNYHYGLTR